jgi:endonuclease G
MAKKQKLPLWASVLVVVFAFLLDWMGCINLSGEESTSTSTPSSGQTSDAALSGSGDHLLEGREPTGVTVTRLDRIGYSLGYDEKRANPAWVAYHLVGGPKLDSTDRPDFHTDKDTVAQVSKGDYTNSGYDRGHMAPNYAIVTRYGEEAQKETFLMSNIIPQTPELNQRSWRMLEEDIAGSGGIAERMGEVWVVTGPIYGSRVKKISDKVAIPSHCYMIIVDEQGGGYRALAFIFPQDPGDDAQPADFLTTIDEIEGKTGLDLFPGIAGEAKLESSRASAVW